MTRGWILIPMAMAVVTTLPVTVAAQDRNDVLADLIALREATIERGDRPCIGDQYHRDQYDYDSRRIRDALRSIYGGYFSPFMRRVLIEGQYTIAVEHIVAASEAHRSGLCDPNRELERADFAKDYDNLTLMAQPPNAVKGDRDAHFWQPAYNRCWFAERVVAVKTEWQLMVDQEEYDSLWSIIDGCDSFRMNRYPGKKPPILAMFDTNGNWAISCSEATEHNVRRPVRRGDPAYFFIGDREPYGESCP